MSRVIESNLRASRGTHPHQSPRGPDHPQARVAGVERLLRVLSTSLQGTDAAAGRDARGALRVLRTGEVSEAYTRDQEWRHRVKANGLVIAVAIMETPDGSQAIHGVTVWRKR